MILIFERFLSLATRAARTKNILLSGSRCYFETSWFFPMTVNAHRV
jgi:hypothetical protein